MCCSNWYGIPTIAPALVLQPCIVKWPCVFRRPSHPHLSSLCTSRKRNIVHVPCIPAVSRCRQTLQNIQHPLLQWQFFVPWHTSEEWFITLERVNRMIFVHLHNSKPLWTWLAWWRLFTGFCFRNFKIGLGFSPIPCYSAYVDRAIQLLREFTAAKELAGIFLLIPSSFTDT